MARTSRGGGAGCGLVDITYQREISLFHTASLPHCYTDPYTPVRTRVRTNNAGLLLPLGLRVVLEEDPGERIARGHAVEDRVQHARLFEFKRGGRE